MFLSTNNAWKATQLLSEQCLLCNQLFDHLKRQRRKGFLSARSIRALIGLAFFSKKKCGHFAQVHRIKTQNVVLSVIIGE